MTSFCMNINDFPYIDHDILCNKIRGIVKKIVVQQKLLFSVKKSCEIKM